MKKLPIIQSDWVEENRFLAGEYPGSYDPNAMRRRIDSFLEADVNTFINLTQPHELLSYETILKEQAKAYGINASHHRFAIRDHSVPSADMMTSILNTIDNAINNGGCVYVHCRGGVGRTGMVVGCYLVRHGVANEQALAQVDKLYKTRPSNPYFAHSPESDEPSETMYTLQNGAVNAGFIFFVLAITATLIFGRFVCGWGCHILALQDLCAWLLKKAGLTPKPFRSRLLVFVPLIAALYMFVLPTVIRYFSKPVSEPLFPAFTNHLITTEFGATFPPLAVAIPFLFICEV